VQYCPPVLLNPDAVRLAMGALDRDGRVELRLYVDQDGVVQEREVVSSSGDETTDRVALGLVGGMRYAPAWLERRRIPARILFDVVFR
jgi:TonB family protein